MRPTDGLSHRQELAFANRLQGVLAKNATATRATSPEADKAASGRTEDVVETSSFVPYINLCLTGSPRRAVPPLKVSETRQAKGAARASQGADLAMEAERGKVAPVQDGRLSHGTAELERRDIREERTM